MATGAWFFAQNGQASEPLSLEELASRLDGLEGPETLVFGPGLSDWTQAKHVGALMQRTRRAAPPPPPSQRRADEIDYEIFGDDMQFVEVTLDPGETVVAEAGAMMYQSEGVKMESRFGDPSRESGGILDKVWTAGKRALTGESLFMTTFSAVGSGQARIGFAAPYPGKIIPLPLDQIGGQILCQKDAFLCAARGVTVDIAFTKRFGAGLFGGEGFILQRLEGDGLAFVHAGGTLMERELAGGETFRVDTGCIAAFQPSVSYDIQTVGGIKNTLFGGEGLFLATLTGPGRIWLQSLPFSRLAGRVYAAAPQTGGKRQGEGSILGGLGNLLDGD